MGKRKPSEILTPETAGRIKETVHLAGGFEAAAKMTGMSVNQLRRYTRGESEPGIVTLGTLARAARVSLDWIFFGSYGEGSETEWEQRWGELDVDLLNLVTEMIERVYAKSGKPLELPDLVRRSGHLYNRIRILSPSEGERRGALAFAEGQLADELGVQLRNKG